MHRYLGQTDPPQIVPTQLIEPKCTEPYYTKEALPTNLPHMQISLLHQTYPGQTDLPQIGPTQLIEPKCTEPYYTKEALPDESTPDVDCAITPDRPPANWPQMETALLH